jgi:hypothetical protein
MDLAEIEYMIRCGKLEPLCLCDPETRKLVAKGINKFSDDELMAIIEIACCCNPRKGDPKLCPPCPSCDCPSCPPAEPCPDCPECPECPPAGECPECPECPEPGIVCPVPLPGQLPEPGEV